MCIPKGEYLSFLYNDDFFNEILLNDTLNVADNIIFFLFKIYNNNNSYSNIIYGIYDLIRENVQI